MSGNFHKASFEKSYSFLGDYRQAEIDRLRNDDDPKKQKELARLMTIVGEEKKQKQQQRAIKVVRKMNEERVKKGLAPVYVSRGKVKEIVKSFQSHTKANEIKQNRRKAAKDHVKVPQRRNFKD